MCSDTRGLLSVRHAMIRLWNSAAMHGIDQLPFDYLAKLRVIMDTITQGYK